MPGTPPLPPWPVVAPAAGAVLLRRFTNDYVPMLRDLATDPYLPLIGSLPADADESGARDWIQRSLRRWDDGEGSSFAIAEAATGRAVGAAGLWLEQLGEGRASAGYCVAPRERGHGYAAEAMTALTGFAWTLPGLHRVQLHIEPWNTASVRTAERAAYLREGLLRSYQEIGGVRRDMLVYAAVRPT